jgi:hypothetical protein
VSKPTEWSADRVHAALRKGPLREPAHAWLHEVGNATGARCERHADALVVSLWPSRGIWLAGVETKVSRSDWKRELDDPAKSHEIQRYCDYWWVAAPEGVVELSEVPERWGLYVVTPKRVVVAKPAPKLEPEPLRATFVAAVMRRIAENQSMALARARDAGALNALESAKEETQARRVELSRARSALVLAEGDADRLRHRVRQLEAERVQFERCAGLPEGTLSKQHGDMRHLAAQYVLAGVLQQHRPERLAEALEDAAAALRAIPEVTT